MFCCIDLSKGEWGQQPKKITFEIGSTKRLSFVQVQSLEYRNVRNASIAIIITWTTIGAVSTPIWIQHRLQVVPTSNYQREYLSTIQQLS